MERGTRRPEQIIDSSKLTTLVMLSGTADGTVLPPYVTYKAGNLYDSWTDNGPIGEVYKDVYKRQL